MPADRSDDERALRIQMEVGRLSAGGEKLHIGRSRDDVGDQVGERVNQVLAAVERQEECSSVQAVDDC